MRKTILTLTLLAAVPLAAQQQQAADKDPKDPTVKVKSAGLPATWTVRLDDKEKRYSADDTRFVTMGSGYHVTSGPAALYYSSKDMPTGVYTARATFSQAKPSGHEAYGIFIGGSNLVSPEQQYFYFLVRPVDGNFYVAHRAGAEVHKIVPWTAQPAVNKQDETGKANNELTLQVTADSVHMSVNGQRVKSFAKSELHGFNTDGQAGLRINHNLDVHVGAFEIKK